MNKLLTEEQIEEFVEHHMDRLDRRFNYDIISEHQYNLAVEALESWANEQLCKLLLRSDI